MVNSFPMCLCGTLSICQWLRIAVADFWLLPAAGQEVANFDLRLAGPVECADGFYGQDRFQARPVAQRFQLCSVGADKYPAPGLDPNWRHCRRSSNRLIVIALLQYSSPSSPVSTTNLTIQATRPPQIRQQTPKYPSSDGTPNLATVPRSRRFRRNAGLALSILQAA
jgi:hypothetical protein